MCRYICPQKEKNVPFLPEWRGQQNVHRMSIEISKIFLAILRTLVEQLLLKTFKDI